MSIPDSKFENALIDQGYDDVEDGEVLKHNIMDISELNIVNLKIKDLTGIEAFDNLTELNFSGNYVTSVDLSKNTLLRSVICSMNPLLTSIDISNNPDIAYLYCSATPIAQLDLSKNTKLKYMDCSYTELTALDLSDNPLIKGLTATNCKLASLDFRNHAAANVESINTLVNPDLRCLYVDDVAAFKVKFTDLDATTSFVANDAECEDAIAVSIENIKEGIQIDVFPNPASDYFSIDTTFSVHKVSVYNLSGEVVKVYSNPISGRYSTSGLPTGSYFVFIETNEGNSVTKLMIKKS